MCGAKVAAYKACLRLTTNVVTTMMAVLVPLATKPAAMNCEEPANTIADIADVPKGDIPLVTATAPKISPKGTAPMTRGIVALTPAQNSLFRLGWIGDGFIFGLL